MRRLLVVADSDSYLKWGAAIATRVPGHWLASVVIVRTPVEPSARQVRAALAGTAFQPGDVASVAVDDLVPLVRERRPDAVLLALRGPMVRLVSPLLAALPGRPVLVSGFPGLTIPAVPKAIVFRELVDLIVLHSRREVRDFRANAERMPVSVAFGLATLPFLAGGGTGPREPGRDVVFAAQAKVPAAYEDRVRLLGWLVSAARAQPQHRVVIKVRALAGEAQTHAETFAYPELLADADVLARIGPLPDNLVVADGPMAAHVAAAAALVTVSSTAVLEAIAAGVPALLVDDFGVGAATINEVFVGSGLLGSHEELVAGRYHDVDPVWAVDNYFHGEADDDWTIALDALAEARERHPLPNRERAHDLRGGALRRAYERRKELGRYDTRPLGTIALAIGLPVRFVLRRLRRLRLGAQPGMRRCSST